MSSLTTYLLSLIEVLEIAGEPFFLCEIMNDFMFYGHEELKENLNNMSEACSFYH